MLITHKLLLWFCLITVAVFQEAACCDCDYHPGGCSISIASTPNTACQCKYMGAWTCSGTVVTCKDNNSAFCKKPDRSYQSCLQGGGDCDGYQCDCEYHPGGCAISHAAPELSACQCDYKGGWTCQGVVVPCHNESSNFCKHPDRSVYSCLEGGGDCEGYQSATCDCDYHRGGCTISKPPPPRTACHCKYMGAWTCRGDITRCINEDSPVCQHPDKSLQTCLQGGGDCGGYKHAQDEL